MATVAMPHVMSVRLDFYEQALFIHFRNDRLARLVTVKPFVFSCKRVHRAVVVHNADHGQIVPQAHFKVVGIVRRRDLHGARTEFGFDVLVCHDGDLAVGQRQ